MNDPLAEFIQKELVRAVTYGRVSTKKQSEEGKSLLRQKEELHAKVERMGWTHIGHFEDPGVSGGSLKRKELSKVRRLIRSGEVDVLVFASLDRLSRGIYDFLVLLEEAEDHGVRLVSLDSNVDTTTPQGRAFVHMAMVFAEFERGMIRKRVIEGKAAARARGEWIGGSPAYGLIYKKEKGLLLDPIKAPQIRELFRSYLRLQSTTAVASYMREKFPSGRKWKGNAVSGALKNPFYLGKILQKDGGSLPGKHEAIIDEGTFDRVQEILTKNKIERRPGTKAYKHGIVIVDLVECSCGSRVTVHHGYNRGRDKKTSKRYDRIRCRLWSSKKAKGPKKGCQVTPVLGLKLQEACLDIIARAAKDSKVVRRSIEKLQKIKLAELEEAQVELKTLRTEDKQLGRQVKRILKLAQDGKSPGAKDHLAELESTRVQVKDRIGELKQLKPAVAPSKYHLTRAVQALQQFSDLYESMDFALRKRLFEARFQRIIWHGNYATLVFSGGERMDMLMDECGEFITGELVGHVPAGMELKTRRMDPARECLAVDCAKPRKTSGLCGMHYKRTKATGKPRAKLTEEQVAEIRRLKKANPKLSTRKLGEQFGVSHNAVAALLRGYTWK